MPPFSKSASASTVVGILALSPPAPKSALAAFSAFFASSSPWTSAVSS